MLDIGNNRFTFRVKAGQNFDHETEPTITVTVTGAGETYNFAITVDDVYIAPRITSGDSHSFFRENFSTTNETQIYQAKAEYETGTATLTWSLSGTDSSLFNIDANGWIRFVSTTRHDYETNPRYDITLEMRLDGNIVATKDLSFAVIDVNDEAPVFATQLGTTVLTASDSVHLYRAPVDGSRDPAAATTVFLSSADLENDGTFRPGVEGNPPITITLLRDSGAIEITGNIAGVDRDGNEDDYYIWAVRNGETWSLAAYSSNGSPQNADEYVFLYSLSENGPTFSSTNFRIFLHLACKMVSRQIMSLQQQIYLLKLLRISQRIQWFTLWLSRRKIRQRLSSPMPWLVVVMLRPSRLMRIQVNCVLWLALITKHSPAIR